MSKQTSNTYSFSISADPKEGLKPLQEIIVPVSNNSSAQEVVCEATTDNPHVKLSCKEYGEGFRLYAESIATSPTANNLRPTDYAESNQDLENLNTTLAWEAYDGDLNGNGTVQTVDARMARFIGVGGLEANPEQRTAGDVNNDNQVNAADASMIVYYALNDAWPSADTTTRKTRRDGTDTPILFSIDNVSCPSGAEVTATLSVNDLVNTTALNLTLVYDPQVIEAITRVNATDLTTDANLVYDDDGNGQLRLSADRQTAMTGSGAFATLTIKLASDSPVKTSRLLIGAAQLYDNIGRNFTTFDLHTVAAEAGEVTITDVDQPPPEPDDNLTELRDLLPSTPGTGAIYSASGQVFDQDGNPMSNVTVTLDTQTVTSDANGYWNILGLTPGEYPVSVSQDGYTFNAATCVIAVQQNCRLNLTGSKNAQPADCQLYAVDDAALNDSQFFTIDLDSYSVNALGPLYPGHDIEALAIHPTTNALYAASGNDTNVYQPRGFLYKVDGDTGELIKIGDTGFEEIGDLAFDAEQTLWAWAKGEGLITLDINTGVGTLIMPSAELLEGLTFAKDQGTILYGGLRRQLVIYDLETGTLGNACAPNLGQLEALEMMADGVLLVGIHEDGDLKLHALDPTSCTVVNAAEIPIQPYTDVEGIALPIAACTR